MIWGSMGQLASLRKKPIEGWDRSLRPNHHSRHVLATLATLALLNGCTTNDKMNNKMWALRACEAAIGGRQALFGQTEIALRSFQAATGINCAAILQPQRHGALGAQPATAAPVSNSASPRQLP